MPNREPETKPVAAVPEPSVESAAMSSAVKPSAPPTPNAAVAPLATTRLAAVHDPGFPP